MLIIIKGGQGQIYWVHITDIGMLCLDLVGHVQTNFKVAAKTRSANRDSVFESQQLKQKMAKA